MIGLPRMCGDDPNMRLKAVGINEFAPHVRG